MSGTPVRIGAIPLPTNARIDGRINEQKGQPEGLAPLDGSGLLPDAAVPSRLTEAQLGEEIDARIVASGLEPGSGFVLSTDPDGCLVFVAQLAPPPDLPAKVSGLAVEPGRAAAALSWSSAEAPDDGPVTDYRVEYRASGAPSWSVFPHAASAATTITVTGLANNVAYSFRVAGVNVSGVGAFSDVETVTVGLVDGVVLDDTFTRTSADLVGSTPDQGLSNWAGAANQLEVASARARGKAGAAGSLVSYDLRAKGDKSIDAIQRVSTEAASTATTGRLYLAFGGSAANFYLLTTVSTAGVATYQVRGNFGSGDAALPAGFPNNTIPPYSAVAEFPVHFELVGRSWTVTVNGVTKTGTLNEEQYAVIKDVSVVGVTAAGNATNVMWERITVSVDGIYL